MQTIAKEIEFLVYIQTLPALADGLVSALQMKPEKPRGRSRQVRASHSLPRCVCPSQGPPAEWSRRRDARAGTRSRATLPAVDLEEQKHDADTGRRALETRAQGCLGLVYFGVLLRPNAADLMRSVCHIWRVSLLVGLLRVGDSA